MVPRAVVDHDAEDSEEAGCEECQKAAGHGHQQGRKEAKVAQRKPQNLTGRRIQMLARLLHVLT